MKKLKNFIKHLFIVYLTVITTMFATGNAIGSKVKAANVVEEIKLYDVGGYNAKLPGNYSWFNQLNLKHIINGIIALCLEMTNPVGSGYSQVDANDLTIRTFDVNKRVVAERPLTKEKVKLLTLYGYIGIIKSDKTNVDIAATQLLAWEVANDANFGYGNNPLGPWRAFSANGVTYEEPTDAVKRRFAEIKEEAKQLQTLPSFNRETITLKLNESVTLTDTNHVIDKFMATKGYDFTHEGVRYQSANGNQLVVTLVDASANATSSPHIYNLRDEDIISSDEVKLFKSSSGGQTLFQPSGFMDPQSFRINLNIVKSAHVEILKVDEKGNVVPGVVFEQSTKPDFSSDTYEFTTGADGIARDTWNRGDVTIYVREKSVPSHLVKSNEVKQVQLITGQTTKVQFINQIVRGNVEVLKVAEHDYTKVLPGAVFELRKDGKVIDTQTTGADGIARFTKVEYGEYEVVEMQAPNGYFLPKDNSRKVKIETEKQVIQFTAINEAEPTIQTQAHGEGQAVREVVEPKEKQMITETANLKDLVIGETYKAVIELFNKLTKVVDQIREIEFVATATEMTITENFEVNGFEYVEGLVFAEDLYRQNRNGEWELKATHNKNYEDKDQTITFKKHGNIVVRKVDSQDGQLITARMKFGLFRNGELIEEQYTVDGVATFETKLIIDPAIVYEVKELEAPERYLKSDEVLKVELTETDANQVKTFSYNNTLIPTTRKPKVPTGDSSNILVYGMGAMLALAGLFVLRKKEY